MYTNHLSILFTPSESDDSIDLENADDIEAFSNIIKN